MLTFILFAAALFIETIGTIVSVIGLSNFFGGNLLIIAMAISLHFAKIVSVSFTYKWWNKINRILKTYMIAAICTLVICSSSGTFSFLSGEFQNTLKGNSQQVVLLESLTAEQTRLSKQKESLDKQISQLAENNVRGRTQLAKQFAPELSQINARLTEIDKELPALKVASIEKDTNKLSSIATALGTTPSQIVTYVILVIISVFDPLAIALLIAGNFMLGQKTNKEKEEDNKVQEHAVEKPVVAELNSAEFIPHDKVDPIVVEQIKPEVDVPVVRVKRKYVRKQKPIVEKQIEAAVVTAEKKPTKQKNNGIQVERQGDRDVMILKKEKTLLPSQLEKIGGDSAISLPHEEDFKRSPYNG